MRKLFKIGDLENLVDSIGLSALELGDLSNSKDILDHFIKEYGV